MLAYGTGETEPLDTPDGDLSLALMAVQLNRLPMAGEIEDQEQELLDLMLMVRLIQQQEEAAAIKRAQR